MRRLTPEDETSVRLPRKELSPHPKEIRGSLTRLIVVVFDAVQKSMRFEIVQVQSPQLPHLILQNTWRTHTWRTTVTATVIA